LNFNFSLPDQGIGCADPLGHASSHNAKNNPLRVLLFYFDPPLLKAKLSTLWGKIKKDIGYTNILFAFIVVPKELLYHNELLTLFCPCFVDTHSPSF
jgi:hypothetical protein